MMGGGRDVCALNSVWRSKRAREGGRSVPALRCVHAARSYVQQAATHSSVDDGQSEGCHGDAFWEEPLTPKEEYHA